MIWLGFAMGIMGSLHCAAMCGPFMLGLGTRKYNWFAHALHHAGRWMGYLLMAYALRLLVSPLHVMEWQQALGLISGLLIVLYGLKYYVRPIQHFFERISSLIGKGMHQSRSGVFAPISLGILNGLLPCGLSFGAASLSITIPTWWSATAFILLFGLGTLPVLLVMTSMPRWGSGKWLLRTNRLLPKVLMLMGVLLILRSSGLGIPYLSPAIDPVSEEVECCE